MKEYGLFYIRKEQNLPMILEKFPDLKGNKNVKLKKQDILIIKGSTLYQQVKDYLDSSKIDYLYNERAEFEPREYEEAEFFDCAGDSINDWGYEFGTQYKVLSGCDDRDCYTIEEQISPLHLDTKKFGNHDFKMLLSREFLVSKRFHDLIETNELTGCSFLPVMHRKGEVVTENIFQLQVNNTLPDIAPEFKREVIKCNNCGTEVLIQRDWQFVYKKTDMEKAKDFNLTKEYFSVTYPSRVLIISYKVYELIKKNKIKGIVYVPVRLV
jgi:hypothetical protein